MNSDMLTAAGESVRALLSTMLGDDAPLKFSSLGISDVADLQDDSLALLGVYPGDHRYAVLLDPEWLPLIAGLKLGVQTRAGDDDYQDILKELSLLFVNAVGTASGAPDAPAEASTLQIKAPGEALDDAILERNPYKLPFFMEWEGALLHGFVLVTKEDAQDSDAEAETEVDYSSDTETMADAIEPEDAPESRPAAAAGAAASPAPTPGGVRVQAAEFPDLGGDGSPAGPSGNLGLLAGVELEVTVELGRRRMPLSDILRLTSGSVLELEKLVGEPLQIFANNRFIAEGEAVVIDEQFGVRITALASRGAGKVAN